MKVCTRCGVSKPPTEYYSTGAACKACLREKQRAYRKEHPYDQIAWRLRKSERLAGRPRPKNCELCGKERRLVWDHCHESSKFRGWLCSACNNALGMVQDSIPLLRAMIEYLERRT